MDIKKDYRIVQCDILAENGSERIIAGAKQIRKALQSGRAVRVFLALNADPAVTGPLAAACAQRGIACDWVKSMQALGRACGIEVGAAAAALVR